MTVVSIWLFLLFYITSRKSLNIYMSYRMSILWVKPKSLFSNRFVQTRLPTKVPVSQSCLTCQVLPFRSHLQFLSICLRVDLAKKENMSHSPSWSHVTLFLWTSYFLFVSRFALPMSSKCSQLKETVNSLNTQPGYISSAMVNTRSKL